MDKNRSGIRAFASAMWANWFGKMSGPLSVPAAIAALWVTNDTAKVLLVFTAFVCAWATAYAVWKPERQKILELETAHSAEGQEKLVLLDDIAALRIEMGTLRIEIQQDSQHQIPEAQWQRKFDDLQNEIASKIERYSSKAEARAYRHRGNIERQISQYGGYLYILPHDLCVHDLDYLKDFIHDYSRHKERQS